jgi:hypothetical protein
MDNVMDLNDLVQSVKFTVLEKNYEIPPMNDIKMKKVMSLSKKITALTKATEDPEDSMSDQQEEELLNTQNTILHACVNLNVDDKLSQVNKEDFALWPMRLKNKVLELVFDQIGGGGTPEGETEKN